MTPLIKQAVFVAVAAPLFIFFAAYGIGALGLTGLWEVAYRIAIFFVAFAGGFLLGL